MAVNGLVEIVTLVAEEPLSNTDGPDVVDSAIEVNVDILVRLVVN